MFRLLNLLLREWKMCQLECWIEAKKYPKILKAYNDLNQVPEDLQEPTKK